MKENTMRVSAIIIAGVLLAAATAAAPGAPMKPQAKVLPAIDVVATADQKFAPDHIVLHVNKRQTLRFTSSGGVHGIASPDLGIPATMIMPDKSVSFAVTPKKAGAYVLPCTIVCGPNHADMALKVEVKP
jgi:heme/copper-type cytochrome/quinol oxidase subunit 2